MKKIFRSPITLALIFLIIAHFLTQNYKSVANRDHEEQSIVVLAQLELDDKKTKQDFLQGLELSRNSLEMMIRNSSRKDLQLVDFYGLSDNEVFVIFKTEAKPVGKGLDGGLVVDSDKLVPGSKLRLKISDTVYSGLAKEIYAEAWN